MRARTYCASLHSPKRTTVRYFIRAALGSWRSFVTHDVRAQKKSLYIFQHSVCLRVGELNWIHSNWEQWLLAAWSLLVLLLQNCRQLFCVWKLWSSRLNTKRKILPMGCLSRCRALVTNLCIQTFVSSTEVSFLNAFKRWKAFKFTKLSWLESWLFLQKRGS